MTASGTLTNDVRPRCRFVASGGAALLLLLGGCASQGPLRPPSLHLPAMAQGLSAARIGDGVDLQWTSPTRTTDGLPLTGKHVPQPLQAEICREATDRATCQPIQRLITHSGSPEQFHDTLPAALTVGPPRLLRYRLCMRNGAGKGAACNHMESLAGAAPGVLQGLQAAPTQGGVLLQWQRAANVGGDRILLRVTRGDMPSGGTKGNAGAGKESQTLLAIEPAANDLGGAVDTAAKPGVAQQYSVARTRTVHVGSQDLVMSGPPSLVTVAGNAKLPLPGPPTGFEAIASTLGVPEIDLVWQPVTGATGYLVFRASGNGDMVALTAEPVQGLTFTDQKVSRGGQYRYSIASVGSGGVAGTRGGEVTEQVPDR